MTAATSLSAKQGSRVEALARRDALDPAWRAAASLKMAEAAGDIGAEPGAVVSGFWPIRSEADPRALMERLREKGARIALPAVVDRETILFREFLSGAELVPAGFGTMGPGREAGLLDPQILLVPLAAFDAQGRRIGYGAGHYDRAVARLRAEGHAPRLIGIGFDCQQLAEVAQEAHDLRLDAILTESGLRRFPPAP